MSSEAVRKLGLIGGATSGSSTLPMGGVPDYTGKYTAAPTNQETALINMLFGRAGGTVPTASLDEILSQFTAGGTALQTASEADLLKTLSGAYLRPESNPFLAASIESAIAPLRNEWEQSILPALKVNFTRAGQQVQGMGSSPFDREARLAGSEFGRQVGDVATRMSAENYANERNRMLAALGLAGEETGRRAGVQATNIAGRQAEKELSLAERGQQTQELVTTLQNVALPRLIEQYGIDQGVAEFRNRLDKLLQLLNMQSALATGTTAPGVTVGSQSPGIGGLLQGAGELAAGAAPLYTALSDHRLKTDIIPLGASVFGMPLYEFRYIFGGPRRWGVMADEVPARARIVLPSGFLAVNYAALGA